MIHAYNHDYLEDAMSTLGAMLDYAVGRCGEGLEFFFSRFLASGIATQWCQGNPKYLAGMSGTELALSVASRTGRELPLLGGMIDIGSPEYWTGWTMAYIAWYLNMDFQTLHARGVTITELYARYSVLHEADLQKSLAFAEGIIQSNKNNPLKKARRNAGLTQQELAGLTGINLRSIRAYEQGQLSLENAGASTLLRFSQVLGCPVGMLL